MTTKHTPGPWMVKENKKTGETKIIFYPKDTRYLMTDEVLYTNASINKIQKANAALIAAAPELLEALKAAYEELVDLVENGIEKDGKRIDVYIDAYTLDLCKTAIADAEGVTA